MSMTRLFLFAAGAILFCGCLMQASATGVNISSSNKSTPAIAPKYPALPSGNLTEKMVFGGYNRTFLIHVPPSYDGSKPYPLLLIFHGLGGRIEDLARASGFNEEADNRGFIVVYPQGLGDGPRWAPSWNAGACCGFARNKSIDDVGFVNALIDNMEGMYNIDKGKIYSTGFSNGAMMTYLLGCRLSDRLAAIAPVSGAIEVNDCNPSRKIPLITFHGTADTAVPFNGGRSSVAANPAYPVFKPVLSEVGYWASLNGCSGNSTVIVAKNVSLLSYSGCTGEVNLYTIYGGTHVWPGNPSLPPYYTDRQINATEKILDFFRIY